MIDEAAFRLLILFFAGMLKDIVIFLSFFYAPIHLKNLVFLLGKFSIMPLSTHSSQFNDAKHVKIYK